MLAYDKPSYKNVNTRDEVYSTEKCVVIGRRSTESFSTFGKIPIPKTGEETHQDVKQVGTVWSVPSWLQIYQDILIINL